MSSLGGEFGLDPLNHRRPDASKRPVSGTPSWPKNRTSASASLATLAARTIRPVTSTTHTLHSNATSIPA